MKTPITKITKQEKEKIENRLLTVFAVALGSVMVLLYLINWFNGSQGFQTTAKVVVYVFMLGFIGLGIYTKIKAHKLKKEQQLERSQKYNNWFYLSIAGFIVSFLTYPSGILGLVKLSAFDTWAFNSLKLFGLFPLATRLVLIMIAIGIYTLVTFIYYSLYLRKAKKAALNKGAAKKQPNKK